MPRNETPLGCGLRNQTAGASEQTEGWHLPQHIVGHQRRRLLDCFIGQDADACRDITEPLLDTPGRDRNRFEQRRWFDDDGDFSGAL
jgi:hypothetical protein